MRFFVEPRSVALGLFVGAAAGGATTLVCVRHDLLPKRLLGERKSVTVLPPEKPPEKSVPPLEARYDHPALKYGPRVSTFCICMDEGVQLGVPSPGFGHQNLRIFDGFVAAFDSRTRNPSWVLEHLTWYKDRDEAVDRKRSVFSEDPLIDKRFRNKLDDFRDSGYDRGHMAPAANHKQTQKAMDDTFTLTNISPQVGEGFNRDYWARFEKFVRNLVRVSAAVFVATGPLWLPEREAEGKYMMKYPMIGNPPALVSVPTHFYKVILAEPKDKLLVEGEDQNLSSMDCAVAAFVMPNRSIAADVPLTRFAVPISDLESATGLTFFPKFMTDEKRALLDRASLVWRSIGRALHGKSNIPLLQTLDGLDPENKPPKKSVDLAPTKKEQLQPIIGKKCALEPHLCYHTECKLPPPDFWKKSESQKKQSDS